MKKSERDDLLNLIASIMEAIDFCKNNQLDEDMKSTFHNDFSNAFQSVYKNLFLLMEKYELKNYNNSIKEIKESTEIIDENSYDDLLNILYNIKSKLESEMVTYEMVFMPYHITMWDSMESIWEEAVKDPCCIPYVIPIPYYCKDEKGNIGEMEYDGNKFPSYVPITDYREYNIQEKRPEIIFFHNPYDNYNRVTTVHPDYYSDKLKNASRLLIYVPYFIFADYVPGMYINLPGIKNADAVFVQSEEIAEKYRESYIGKDKDKFYPVGSPKMDRAKKINKMDREDLPIPDEWKEKCRNKTVVLYNTHLNSIINSGEKFLKKISYVINKFKNNKEAVLLWRPHPLSQATATALNPGVYERYLEIVNEFIKDGSGIYDKDGDLDVTIAMSDGYFGDGSSLIEICRELEMPVMLQEFEYNRDPLPEEMECVNFEDVCFSEDKMWFFSSVVNGLYSKDNLTGKVMFHGKVPGEKDNERRLYSGINNIGEKIVLTPFRGKKIGVYDIKKEEFKTYSFDKYIDSEINYYGSIVLDEDIYMFPLVGKTAMRFCPKTGEIDELKEINNVLLERESDETKLSIFNGISSESKIYLPSGSNGAVYVYDIVDKSVEIIEISGKMSGFSSVEKFGDKLYLFPMNSREAIVYDLKEKIYDYIELIKGDMQATYYSTCSYRDKIYILDVSSSFVMSLDVTNNDVDIIHKIPEQGFYEKKYFFEIDRYINIIVNNGELIIPPFGDRSMEKISLEDQEVVSETIRSKENMAERIYPMESDSPVLFENSYKDLDEYIKLVSKKKTNKYIENEETVGSKIYHMIV